MYLVLSFLTNARRETQMTITRTIRMIGGPLNGWVSFDVLLQAQFFSMILFISVYGVCILDMLQTGFTTQFVWFYCIQNWGNVDVFTTSATFAWTASFMPIMAGLSKVYPLQCVDLSPNISIFRSFNDSPVLLRVVSRSFNRILFFSFTEIVY